MDSTHEVSPNGCVAKNHSGHKNTEHHFSSGGNLEEIGHESILSANVAFRRIPLHPSVDRRVID
jgi:hypothetical protein